MFFYPTRCETILFFTDNELRWFGHAVTNHVSGLFDVCAAKKDGHSAKAALVSFLAKRGLKIGGDIPVSVKRDFLAEIAELYYSTVSAATRLRRPSSFRRFQKFFPSHFFTSAGTSFRVIIVEVLLPQRRC